MREGPPPLRVVRAADLAAHEEGPRWLIREVWPHSAVGIAGGQPKSWKSWLALDMATSVASGTPCLGRFPVDHPGPALVYMAEDALPDVRNRIECLCRSRGLALDRQDVRVIAEPVLRLDSERDRDRLRDAVERTGARLLVLDPLVRIHRGDENSSQEVSALLGYLRELQRERDASIVLVHHTSKRAHARHGQALRGSSDLHAWTDVGLYLTWHGDELRLTPELRVAPALPPLSLRLADEDPAKTHLAIVGSPRTSAPSQPVALPQAVLEALERAAPRARRRGELRQDLRVNNARLGDALADLERLNLVVRADDGWRLAQGQGPPSR
ncbi:MAG: AAA family ATPase [Burkholderiales bacterium]